MSNQEIICRLCRYPISATNGCEICRPAKENFVWLGYDTQGFGDRNTPDELAQELATMLRSRMKALRQEMREDNHSAQHTKELVQITRAFNGLLSEMRKIDAENRTKVDQMTFEDQVSFFIDQFFTTLPGHHRERLLHAFEAAHAKLNSPTEANLLEESNENP